MSETKKQIISELDRYYKNLKMKNEILREELIEKIYTQYPDLQQIQDEIDKRYLKKMKNQVFKKPPEKNLDYEIKQLKQQKLQLIQKYKINKEIFNKIYTCKICKDTGYITDPYGNTERCVCYINHYKKLAYGEDELMQLTQKCNFENFRLDIFDNRDLEDKMTQREFMQKMLKIATEFIKDFDNPDTKSLFFYGKTGQGKTYLSLCIAERIIRRTKTVLYKSSIELFDKIAAYCFSNNKEDSEEKIFYDLVYASDLLIIDDLGTEITNSFIKTQLFNIINERMIKGKKTIISTNIKITEITDRYDERISSRIIKNYDIYKFIGSDRRIYDTN